MTKPTAAIYGLAGPEVNEWERGFFREANPLGFILFKRNIQNREQTRKLTDSLKNLLGHDKVHILIDQEGGRVQRLKPPHWRNVPAAGVFAKLSAKDYATALYAAELNAMLIAEDLDELGITVDCAPVADLLYEDAHDIVGDRAYGSTPRQVADFARAVIKGFTAHGIHPVMKHIPGHGRAMVDSHYDLPVVSAPRQELEEKDFQVFRDLRDCPWAMTAHIVYSSIDQENPATTSRTIIDEIIRKSIGFEGILLSDDLSMQALAGSFTDRARMALDAGCDLVLHCNGAQAEMMDIAKGTGTVSDQALARLYQAESLVSSKKQAGAQTSANLAELEKILRDNDLHSYA
jgi:beta-N-acetylhexosaminidase